MLKGVVRPLRAISPKNHASGTSAWVAFKRDVNAGTGKVRAHGDASKYLLPISRLDATHMKRVFLGTFYRFLLTEHNLHETSNIHIRTHESAKTSSFVLTKLKLLTLMMSDTIMHIMNIPDYITLSQNHIGIDWKLFEKSPEYARELENTKQLVRYLKNERKN